ncbi:MAG: Efflux ABC transporter [Candidatus Levybacteria bacterium GW2011_GWA2_40_8]|nr:MAG: Efflux ABC transporter [Candidatus Levybacteria bacterium GW2011_GWA2_40_8]
MNSRSSAWKNIRRSPYQAIAAVFIMMMTFLVFSFFVFIFVGSSKVISYFESKPQVTAFFKDEASQEEINSLRSGVEATGRASEIRFVSKDEALKIYQEQNKNDPLLLELVTAEILPASLEISTHEIEDLSLISSELSKSPIVQEVIYQRDVIATLTSWTNALRRVGIASIIVLSLVSIFIMATIIGIKISHKRQDIEIMRLIGATNWYIRKPYLLEGVFYGVLGSFMGWMLATLSLWYATPFLSTFLRGIPLFPVSFVSLLVLLLLEVILAILLGVLSSYLAVLRYLKT